MRSLLKSFINNPNDTSFAGEDSDEEILFVFRKAMITNVGWIFTTFLITIIPFLFAPFLINLKNSAPNIISSDTVFIILAFWFIFVFGYFFERFLNWYFNVHIITNKRVVDMDFDHILHRNITEAPLRNIEDITYNIKGAFQTTFNFGTIYVQTAAEKREIEFLYVSDPAKIQDMLSDLVQCVRKGSGD